MSGPEVDILSLPDDQALEAINQASIAAETPVVEDATTTPPVVEQVADGGEAVVGDTGEAGGDKTEGGDTGGEVEKTDDVKSDAAPAAADATKTEDVKTDVVADDATKPVTTEKVEVQPGAPRPLTEYTADDKVAAFDQLMAPFKANNKMIELRSPAEALKLMQMGANYTRNMQQLRKREGTLTMLENNGLLDDSKLAFAIDLIKGEPGAIQRLLADSKFDPLTVDMDQAAAYKPGNHQVSDTELAFNRALDDVTETAHGLELAKEVASQWDKESKEWLFQHPDLLRDLNLQKENGVFAQITQEVDRLRTLGQIPAGTPFLQAYNGVGEMLHKAGALKVTTPAKDQELPVEERVIAPAPVVTNNDKAIAAAPTKSTTATLVKEESNVLGLSDADFLKEMEGRV